MTTLFSRQCEYALQAVLFLALKRNEELTSIKSLSKTLDVPHYFLAKILQRLTHSGLLVSQKGSNGGFALSAPSNRITLLQVVEAIDGSEFLLNCALGFPECSPHNPCSLHNQWAAARDGIINLLSSSTIEMMAGQMKKPPYLPDPSTRKSLH
jgi:Rrf2 family iron-sulfur cluster assembly transcriptional regulator